MTRVDTHLLLIVSDEAIRRFCLLTALGFNVEISAACTLRRFLCDRLQIEPDYLETRIQTVFLNFRAVDDPDAAMVTAGSTVGLSGPMPGIAGAT
ncbi:MAG: hypothetical protein FJ276_21315, partial [Planctomycetes bacterium]|nr:hypothetical protein [Planctomycetota bacterium]